MPASRGSKCFIKENNWGMELSVVEWLSDPQIWRVCIFTVDLLFSSTCRSGTELESVSAPHEDFTKDKLVRESLSY